VVFLAALMGMDRSHLKEAMSALNTQKMGGLLFKRAGVVPPSTEELQWIGITLITTWTSITKSRNREKPAPFLI